MLVSFAYEKIRRNNWRVQQQIIRVESFSNLKNESEKLGVKRWGYKYSFSDIPVYHWVFTQYYISESVFFFKEFCVYKREKQRGGEKRNNFKETESQVTHKTIQRQNGGGGGLVSQTLDTKQCNYICCQVNHLQWIIK